MILWRGQAAGCLAGGGPFSPRVRLLGELGAHVARERAARRMEAFVAAESSRRLFVLKRLKAAIADGRLTGLARGLAYQLVEQFGVLDRMKAETQIRALSQKERRALKGLGVRFGAFSLYLPALLSPEARAVGAAFAEIARPGWRPAADGLTRLPQNMPPPEALALRGLRAVAGLAAPVEALERLDALARAAATDGVEAGSIAATPELLAALGWNAGQAERILRALGFTPTQKDGDLWRRRRRPSETPPAGAPASPFAALAGLAAPQPARRTRQRKRHRRAAVAASA
jgi:ATP-dependent RNA helicase SUPV3L1/SUV3